MLSNQQMSKEALFWCFATQISAIERPHKLFIKQSLEKLSEKPHERAKRLIIKRLIAT
jgi:hypothetical protein